MGGGHPPTLILPRERGREWIRFGRQVIFEMAWGCCLLMLMFLNGAAWAEETHERVWVAEPYLDLRTGPGRGYPVFYIAERGEAVEILRRHTDWFEVRTERGKEGWVSREQMETTVTEAGTQKMFGDVLMEDYL